MYDIAVCDDDAAFAAVFQKQLTDALAARGVQARITLFADPAALLAAAEGGRAFDLLFLDVVFSQTQQGIRLASALRQRQFTGDIVFMSTYSDYAVDSYDVQALHYLTKPVSAGKLDAALDRFLRRSRPVTLRFTSRQGAFFVPVGDILYFEIYSHQILIHRTDGATDSCVGTLKELEERLPAGVFVRPHRSYLVNLDHVRKIMRRQMSLSSGDVIPVSKGLYLQAQRAFIDRAGRRDAEL